MTRENGRYGKDEMTVESVQRYALGPDDAHPGWDQMVPSPTGPWVRVVDVIAAIDTQLRKDVVESADDEMDAVKFGLGRAGE